MTATWKLTRRILHETKIRDRETGNVIDTIPGFKQQVWEGRSRSDAERQLRMMENIPVPRGTTYTLEQT